MQWVTLRGTLSKSLVGLAASSICLTPIYAQQPLPRVELGAQPDEAASEKEVTLSADGSFRAAVLTRSGELVPGARLTFTPRQPSTGAVVNAMTGSVGITVVAGTKAGVYEVHVEAPQGVYNGTLRVKTFAEVQQTQNSLPPLVTFVLTPAEGEDEVPGQRDPSRRRLLGAALLGATAIAVPLSLRPARRASP
jgi:hypothetical protein